ncbi:hypothetical protein LX16_2402 [Stackebrandtia albiflava]|uniref:Uncharacterized protein n=1 Tax=Stackebrandtia albiflava TaxID=406432 RepID=A0A562V1F3_9ACTN|nr:hypothetical protein [Stackebrandtia albiflava]TWJ11675.1 hypothetical protein LX16_2402 [Stackebrandtia albiflava]
MTEYSDEQIGRDDLATSGDYEAVILMQSGEVRNAATNAYAREYNHELMSDPMYWDEYGTTGNKINEGDERWWEVWKQFSWIPDLFEPLSTIPNPDKSGELAASVQEVAGGGELDMPDQNGEQPPANYEATGGALGERAMDGHANILTAVTDWRSVAANDFRNNFCKDIPSTLRNQIMLAKILRATAIANQGLLLAARKDSQELARKAKETLDAYNPAGNSPEVNTGFAVAGAVLTIAAGIATGVGGVVSAGALTALAGISSAESLAGTKSDPMGLGGDSVEAITGKIFDGVSKILTELRDGEDTLINQVLMPNSNVTWEHNDMFVVSRPTLIGAPKGDFQPPPA